MFYQIKVIKFKNGDQNQLAIKFSKIKRMIKKVEWFYTYDPNSIIRLDIENGRAKSNCTINFKFYEGLDDLKEIYKHIKKKSIEIKLRGMWHKFVDLFKSKEVEDLGPIKMSKPYRKVEGK